MFEDGCILVYPSVRPNDVRACLDRVRQSTNRPLACVVGLTYADTLPFTAADVGLQYLSVMPQGLTLQTTVVQATNMTFCQAVKELQPTDNTLMAYWSDDFWPSSGWLDKVIEARNANPYAGLFQLWDGCQPLPKTPGCATVPVGTYSFWRDNYGGAMFCPDYTRYSCDVDIVEVAVRDGRFMFLPDVEVFHGHFSSGRRAMDSHDQMYPGYIEKDRDVIVARRAANYPIHWRPMCK